MSIKFSQPPELPELARHHAQAAAGNLAVAEEAIGVLRDALSGDVGFERLLLRAAAGAGKSHVLKRLVVDSLTHPNVSRVAITAFTNNQTHPIARDLGEQLGAHRVCLFVSAEKAKSVPDSVLKHVTLASKLTEIPDEAEVVISPVQKFGFQGSRPITSAIGAAANGDRPFDVLFVDEAWQVASYLFDGVALHAPIVVGVGDVGQIPPLEVGVNPWQGDPGYNPYRAWPTEFERGDKKTWVRDLPAVWRPAAGHLSLWRAFYPDWKELYCVAGEADRSVNFNTMKPFAQQIWQQVATGVPTIVEIDGLDTPEAPDVDLPLILAAETLIDELISAEVALNQADYDDAGSPNGSVTVSSLRAEHSDPLISILATRNQAVDDAADAVERLQMKHNLAENDLVASTVDSWQGQTNGITVAIHPLSGAVALDDFNSAFGRLAVTCTRATHGLLMIARPGIDELLAESAPQPGTPIGEPGFRTLPRQTHERILMSFARARIQWTNSNTDH